jgi:hypothetical protein
MTRNIGIALAAAVLALAPLGCATANSDQHATAPKEGLLGKAQQFAGVAITAAKSFLAQAPPQQQGDKQAAAQAGVAAANTQAQQQGSALSQLEQQALLDWVKSKI